MWTEFKKSISSIFEERITSPFYGSFIFSWMIWNWKIIYLTIFVSQDKIQPTNKIHYIVQNYANWWQLIVFPFVSAVILVTLVPWFSNRLFKIYLFYEKQRTTWREESDSSRRLTVESSAQIRNEILEQEIKHQKQIELKNNEISIANKQIEQLSNDKLKAQENLLELDKLGKEFKILFARYGKNDTYSEVTQIVSDLIATKSKFLVKNEELGGDPLYGVHKELFIVYNASATVKSLTVKEYFETERQNDQLVASETDESKRVYEIKSLPNTNYSLDQLFPGIWQLSFQGRISGSEEMKIRNGNEYYAKTKSNSQFEHYFNIEDLLVDMESKRIEFTKVSVSPQGRTIRNVLSIIEIGQTYQGVEEEGAIKVSYSKLRNEDN